MYLSLQASSNTLVNCRIGRGNPSTELRMSSAKMETVDWIYWVLNMMLFKVKSPILRLMYSAVTSILFINYSVILCPPSASKLYLCYLRSSVPSIWIWENHYYLQLFGGCTQYLCIHPPIYIIPYYLCSFWGASFFALPLLSSHTTL